MKDQWIFSLVTAVCVAVVVAAALVLVHSIPAKAQDSAVRCVCECSEPEAKTP